MAYQNDDDWNDQNDESYDDSKTQMNNRTNKEYMENPFSTKKMRTINNSSRGASPSLDAGVESQN